MGRQVRLPVEETGKYLDLLGVGSSGDVVIVELKKGRTPREIVAQLLEYSAWIDSMNYEDLNEIAIKYFQEKDTGDNRSLLQAYQEVFLADADEEEEISIEFNTNQKLFIVAEEITPTIRQVTSHLRTKYQMNIFSMEYKIQKTEQCKFYLGTEKNWC